MNAREGGRRTAISLRCRHKRPSVRDYILDFVGNTTFQRQSKGYIVRPLL
jgi:hypothetical protein